MMIIINLLGLPASGKGTQAKLLAKKINAEILGSGDLVREEIENCDLKDPFCKMIKERYDKGIPQPDEIMADLIQKNIKKINKNIILDNYPFNKNQVLNFKKLSDELKINKSLLILIEISREEVIKRISLRKVCPNCGQIYNNTSIDFCENCQTALSTRSDDDIDIVKKRINKYIPSIKEVVEEYSKIGEVIIINGEKSIKEVEREITGKLKDEGIIT